jgi:acetoin utilization deacetylase AcuC-like enzyme
VAYCTFNGLMVTAAALKAEGLGKGVGIIDCDNHYGDGTDAIIEHIGAQGWIRHFSAGLDFGSREQVGEFFKRLETEVEGMADCDLILYQAGADPHVNDPLGGWLTTEQLAGRDGIIFGAARRLGRPIVWNLAGGYQKARDGSIPRVLEIHDNTVRECVSVYGLGA